MSDDKKKQWRRAAGGAGAAIGDSWSPDERRAAEALLSRWKAEAGIGEEPLSVDRPEPEHFGGKASRAALVAILHLAAEPASKDRLDQVGYHLVTLARYVDHLEAHATELTLCSHEGEATEIADQLSELIDLGELPEG
jgi:hypothetical protein